MARPRNLPLFVVLIVVGAVGLTRFAPGVRTVNVVGLFASGMAVGSAVRGIAAGLRQTP